MTLREWAKEIKLTKGQIAIVDADMFDYLNQFKWCAVKGRYGFRHCMRGISVNGRNLTTLMHHVVIGKPLWGLHVDHINGNPFDNRRENLRIVTSRENSMNQKKHRNGKLVGSSPQPYGRWHASIKIKGKTKYLGSFETDIDAHHAYMEAAKLASASK